ncbi:unnamed protein product, partial [Allacma fusca]
VSSFAFISITRKLSCSCENTEVLHNPVENIPGSLRSKSY